MFDVRWLAMFEDAGCSTHARRQPAEQAPPHLYVTGEIAETEAFSLQHNIPLRIVKCARHLAHALTLMYNNQQHGGLLKRCCIVETPPHTRVNYLGSLRSAGALGE